ncbi:hypothetical protein [Vibrio navarrensis]|uniref:hypothetical protein n=2 Tax=Vibrio navarrensis TaxID=29495 RepID=UPI001869ED1B|nr:hypothetical protein [Vibrio navarrensis]EJK2117039.1 hypothetical protein [Vibrio navarrensis]MBE4617058.1 hypothetical protein [Vibrio navarrensis]QOD68583.1 hypothetical protein IF132_06425 [Vibrio navarrensis]
MFQNLVVGLVSGLVVSFIVLVVGRAWRAIVEPWFEERVYKDLHIEGKWYSLYVDTDDYRQEAINLKRHGHSISGHMICKTGADDGEEYSLCGSFRNLLLPLTYEASDKKKSDRGTITLMSTHNGERFVGEVAMYETKTDSICTGHVIWFRNKKDLEETVSYIKQHREQLQKLRVRERELRAEFAEFFEEVAQEFAKRKMQERKAKEDAIEGEVHLVEDKKANKQFKSDS